MSDTNEDPLVKCTDAIRGVGINMDRTHRTVGSLRWGGMDATVKLTSLYNTKAPHGAVKDDLPVSLENCEL